MENTENVTQSDEAVEVTTLSIITDDGAEHGMDGDSRHHHGDLEGSWVAKSQPGLDNSSLSISLPVESSTVRTVAQSQAPGSTEPASTKDLSTCIQEKPTEVPESPSVSTSAAKEQPAEVLESLAVSTSEAKEQPTEVLESSSVSTSVAKEQPTDVLKPIAECSALAEEVTKVPNSDQDSVTPLITGGGPPSSLQVAADETGVFNADEAAAPGVSPQEVIKETPAGDDGSGEAKKEANKDGKRKRRCIVS